MNDRRTIMVPKSHNDSQRFLSLNEERVKGEGPVVLLERRPRIPCKKWTSGSFILMVRASMTASDSDVF